MDELLAGGSRLLVTDLSGVASCDSRLFDLLSRTSHLVGNRGGWVSLVGVGPPVLNALDQAALPEVLPVYRASGWANHGSPEPPAVPDPTLTFFTALRPPGPARVPSMIRDVTEFRRTGVRPTRHRTGPPGRGLAGPMWHAGRRDGARVRTFLLPRTIDAEDPPDQLVFAVRTDPPPDPGVQNEGLLRWWRIDDLNMPFDRWRAALHRVARRERSGPHLPRPAPVRQRCR